MRTAGEISFLKSDVVEHLLHQRDVLRLSTVRCARHCELLVTPAQRLEPAASEKREYLEGLGAGAPVGKRVGVTGCAEQLIAFSDYRSVYAVFGFYRITAADSDIELVRLDHTE